MPNYLSPGVYVEEVDSGPPPIQGVGTSTTAFVGMARRGPVEGRPVLVTNYGEYVRTFGHRSRGRVALISSRSNGAS